MHGLIGVLVERVVYAISKGFIVICLRLILLFIGRCLATKVLKGKLPGAGWVKVIIE